MPDDVNPARRAEYEAALAVLEPQIVGMQSIVNDDDMSNDARNKIQEELDDRLRREILLIAALAKLDACNNAHDALLADGYPDLPKGSVTAEVLDELHARRDAVDVAMGQFESITGSIDLGEAVDKPIVGTFGRSKRE